MLKSCITLVHDGKIKYGGNLTWYALIYHGILTLENVGTALNYRGIFITLAPDFSNIILFSWLSVGRLPFGLLS
jgi:hypothetical protein